MNENLSLFPETQLPTHTSAFDAWITDRRTFGLLREPGSVQVYRDMWGAFTAWCLSQNPTVRLESLNALDLDAFQAARFGMKSSDQSLTPRHALRLMRLIDRVLKHQSYVTGEQPNMAVSHWLSDHPSVRYADAAESDPLPEFLTVTEAKTLIAFVSAARPRPGISPAQRDSQVMTGLGEAARLDSGAMKMIAIVTMAFLPPTFLSARTSFSSHKSGLTVGRPSSA